MSAPDELEVDGKATRVACGPRATDGGFRLTVKMRLGGGIVRAARITGAASMTEDSGALHLYLNGWDGTESDAAHPSERAKHVEHVYTTERD